MAIVRKESVFRATATADLIAANVEIVGVKVFETASGAATIRLRAGALITDPILWESELAADANEYNQVSIRCREGIHIEITGAAVVYIYTK